MKKTVLNFVSILVFLIVTALQAEVTLPSIIGNNMVIQQNTKIPVWGWAEPGEAVKIKGSWQKSYISAVSDDSGKWMAKLQSPVAGGPFEIEIQGKNKLVLKNILSGEVWFASGQSNMALELKQSENSDSEIVSANYPNIRLFHITRTEATQPKTDCDGTWLECTPESVEKFSAVAYYFGKKIQKELNIPVGLISSSKGGSPIEAWISEDTLKANKDFLSLYEMWEQKERDYPAIKIKYRDDLELWNKETEAAEAKAKNVSEKPQIPIIVNDIEKRFHRRPSFLYNAMVAPVIPFAIQGVIWYQGENNVQRPYQYRELFPALIENWRKLWDQGDFPFYYVQIAPFVKRERPQESILMEAQTMTMNIPNTGMVVTTDIGDLNNNHPKNKHDVGERLALWALAKTYKHSDIVYSGPLYKSMKIEGNKIRLYFDHIGSGLMVKGEKLNNFEIASNDSEFVLAEASIEGETVVVTSEEIKHPNAVRFAWNMTTVPNFFNKEGLPAAPFRTSYLFKAKN